MKVLIISVFLIGFFGAMAQETFPVNGTWSKDVTYNAFVHAHIHVDYNTELDDATLLIFKGKVVAVGNDIAIPTNTVIYNMDGKHIYPSFIDLDSNYGQPKTSKSKWKPEPQYESNRKGAFGWNQTIKPSTDASKSFTHVRKNAKTIRSLGFGTVLTHVHDGVARGSSCLVTLGTDEHRDLILSKAAAHYSFDKGSSRQRYPSSLMGSIALLRQTYLDAEWYKSSKRRDKNLTLHAWNDVQSLPQIFEVGNKWDILRADKIGDEFGVQYIFKCRSDVYQRLDDVKNTNGALIISLGFPDPYDVSDPLNTRLISLSEMKHWELAPSNAMRVAAAGIPFSITTQGSGTDFLAFLRKSVKYGLSEPDALKSLTFTPALLIGVDNQLGALRENYLANFLITSNDFFLDDCILYENWVQGERFVITDGDVIDVRGTYSLNIGESNYPLNVEGSVGKPKAFITQIDVGEEGIRDTTRVEVVLIQVGNLLTLSFMVDDDNFSGRVRLSGHVNMESRIWDGHAETPHGEWIEWVAVRQSEYKNEIAELSSDSVKVSDLGAIIYPFIAYGRTTQPIQETVLIKNATLWTCEDEGIIEKGQILIHQGKIAALGTNINLQEVFGKNPVQPIVIDARGKHITPGIIDEHSHIAAARGVNESGQTSSAEVEIGSVISGRDVNVYRQLAGGVTASQILHGSANPIGGQSGMIKLRWGKTPDEMLLENAPGFIKFALGENVKQSNWGDFETVRFPQTRMGVEQVYYDHFIRAREYGKLWEDYENLCNKLTKKQKRKGEYPDKPRRDLELETLLEVLQSERFVTCHSYQQGEINMLMHVADSMGFTLNTFTHILEGYKVADKLAAHGAGGSTFSDWWAYKYEVKDAIPYNGALLWEQGIVTAFNSDDREMARRLNQEAAKAVKYGNVPEQEALKFVTLNPAKLLHLDDRMGSLKVGKDADLVLWDDHPLSVYAKPLKTFVDGICYFDYDQDLEMRKMIREERARLIQKMAGAAELGAKTQAPKVNSDKHYHCDTEYDEFAE